MVQVKIPKVANLSTPGPIRANLSFTYVYYIKAKF